MISDPMTSRTKSNRPYSGKTQAGLLVGLSSVTSFVILSGSLYFDLKITTYRVTACRVPISITHTVGLASIRSFGQLDCVCASSDVLARLAKLKLPFEQRTVLASIHKC